MIFRQIARRSDLTAYQLFYLFRDVEIIIILHHVVVALADEIALFILARRCCIELSYRISPASGDITCSII